MQKMIKFTAATFAVALALSFILTVIGVMSWRLFWLIAIAAGAFAYFGLPRLKS